jgi:hypothetical protein
MRAGGVAVEDLQEEEMDRGNRVQEASAPAEAKGPAQVAQCGGLKDTGQIVADQPDGRQQGRDQVVYSSGVVPAPPKDILRGGQLRSCAEHQIG